jgi:hypothetical protein
MDKKNSSPKKLAREKIAQKLEAAFIDLKTALGDKEFEARIKKASKIFAKGFKIETPKKKAEASTATKPEAPKAKPVAKKAAKKAAAKKK